MSNVPTQVGIHPDKWAIVTLTLKDGDVMKKVLGSWGGGYLDGDSWRFSSPIDKIVYQEDHYEIQTQSGSSYLCSHGSSGMNMVAAEVVGRLRTHPKVKSVEVSYEV